MSLPDFELPVSHLVAQRLKHLRKGTSHTSALTHGMHSC